MSKILQVALMLPAEEERNARELRGITDYAAERGNWTLDFVPRLPRAPMRNLIGWTGDGVIAMAITRPEVRAARALKFPLINLAGSPPPGELCRVCVDQRAVGRTAAEELLECGFRRFAYYALRGPWFSRQRKNGFVEHVRAHGYTCSVLESPLYPRARSPWMQWVRSLERWLRTLELPVGLMAVHDYRANMVVEACFRLGIRVPEDLAVIGVGNFEATCEFCRVPLSSVGRNGRRVGYEAAAMLDRWMAGEPPPPHDVLLPPDGVVKRKSTDVVAVDDPHVATAVTYVREHLGETFGVETLGGLVPVSRRWLEHRFKQLLGCTPHEYICRARVERAKELLAGSERLSVQQVSRACGFSSPHRLRLVFERITGVKLAEYRRS